MTPTQSHKSNLPALKRSQNYIQYSSITNFFFLTFPVSAHSSLYYAVVIVCHAKIVTVWAHAKAPWVTVHTVLSKLHHFFVPRHKIQLVMDHLTRPLLFPTTKLYIKFKTNVNHSDKKQLNFLNLMQLKIYLTALQKNLFLGELKWLQLSILDPNFSHFISSSKIMWRLNQIFCTSNRKHQK